METYATLITAQQLNDLRAANAEPDGSPQGLVILDCRGGLGDPELGPAAWAKGHIPGAQHANLETQLAAPPHSYPERRGGRHPLPERGEFAEQCGKWGITSHTQVVAYDDMGGAFAARCWWMLRWLGHANVAVLDGGLGAWLALPDGTLTTEQPTITEARFEVQAALTKIVSRQEVLASVKGEAD